MIVEISYRLLNQKSGRDHLINQDVVAKFLFDNLDEYRDSLEDIKSAIDYVFDKTGGFVLIQFVEDKMAGVVVLNETGMGGYIPENILVYIAIAKKYRGKGCGKALMKNAIKAAKGDIALHVEQDNPAKYLYEKMGFTNPYLEMRLKKG